MSTAACCSMFPQSTAAQFPAESDFYLFHDSRRQQEARDKALASKIQSGQATGDESQELFMDVRLDNERWTFHSQFFLPIVHLLLFSCMYTQPYAQLDVKDPGPTDTKKPVETPTPVKPGGGSIKTHQEVSTTKKDTPILNGM